MKEKYSLLLLSTGLIFSCTATPNQLTRLPEAGLKKSQLTAPPKGFTIPPRTLTAPPKGFTIPPRSMTAPPKGFSLIEGTVTFPASTNKNLFSVPPRGITAPPRGFTVPPMGFSIPPMSITIPPRGFETQSLKPLDLQALSYAINGTVIPSSRILTNQIQEKANGDLEVSFLTNALPIQSHLIFSATSPSGLVVLGQYLESEQPNVLTLNLEETALALIKNTAQGSSPSLNELRQSPQSIQVTNALNEAIQQDTLSNSILNTKKVKTLLNSHTPPSSAAPETTLKSIAIQPTTLTLNQVGDSQILLATSVDSNGKNQTTLNYQWSSSNPEVAIVDAQGIVTAQGVGTATIMAKSGDLEGVAVVTVQEKVTDKPEITSISPERGKIGDTVTITGKGFATTPTKNTVKFGNKTLEVIANSSREIILTVPNNLIEGLAKITVETPSGISSDKNFNVTVSPNISSLSTSHGLAGSSVVITGVGFSATPSENTVKFNGIKATVTQATINSLTVTVPTGVTSGPISVVVNNETAIGPNFSPMPSGLYHYWKAENNAQDSTGSVNGTEQGATYTSGSSGQGFNFDGINDYVDMGNFDLETTNNSVTIAFWFKAGTGVVGTDARMISKATGTAINDHYFMISNHTVTGNDRLRFRLKTSSGGTDTLIASSGNLSPNVWTFVTATFDGSTMRLYKDATDVGSMSKSGTISTNSSIPVWIGNNPTTPTIVPWDGVLDEVQFYNRALSHSEIQSIYNATKP